MLIRRLQRLVQVYTCQNATLLEISCAGSFGFTEWHSYKYDILLLRILEYSILGILNFESHKTNSIQ